MRTDSLILSAIQRRDCDQRLTSAARALRNSDEIIQRVKEHVLDSKRLVAYCKRLMVQRP